MKYKKIWSYLIAAILISGILLPYGSISVRAAMKGAGTEESPYQIRTNEDLFKIPSNPTAHYVMMNHLNFQNSEYEPMPAFSGVLDGGGYSILNLIIAEEGKENVGLFSTTHNAVIKNIAMKNSKIIADHRWNGAFAGSAVRTEFDNCSIEDVLVSGKSYLGGISGKAADNSTIRNCRAVNSTIIGNGYAGGLAGYLNSSKIHKSYSEAEIKTINAAAGGLVGVISDSFQNPCKISESFALSSIEGDMWMGGLAGVNLDSKLTIQDSYAKSDIINRYSELSSYTSSGLIGSSEYTVMIKNCYYTGSLNGSKITPLSDGNRISSYYDNDLVKLEIPDGQARTTEQMYRSANYEEWDFQNIWAIQEGKSYPQLKYADDHLNHIPVKDIEMNYSFQTILTNHMLQLEPMVLPSYASNKALTYSSSNSNVASVDSSGVVTGVKSGKAVITALAADGSEAAAECFITVANSDIKVTGVRIEADKNILNFREEMYVRAIITPSNATNQIVNWQSSNTEAAIVDAHGRVIGVKEGTAMITAITEDGKFEAEFEITVLKKKVDNPNNSKIEIVLETKEQLLLSVNEEIPVNERMNWTSSDKKVATVDQYGVLTARGSGKAVIMASAGSFVEEIHVMVVGNAVLYRLAVDVKVGHKTRLAMVGAGSANDIVWVSSDKSVAEVTDTGQVTAIAKGLAIISATDKDGDEKHIYIRVRESIEN